MLHSIAQEIVNHLCRSIRKHLRRSIDYQKRFVGIYGLAKQLQIALFCREVGPSLKALYAIEVIGQQKMLWHIGHTAPEIWCRLRSQQFTINADMPAIYGNKAHYGTQQGGLSRNLRARDCGQHAVFYCV